MSKVLKALPLAILGAAGLTVIGCGPSQSPSTLAVGFLAPTFTLPASDGSQVSLSDYGGRDGVLLYFHMASG